MEYIPILCQLALGAAAAILLAKRFAKLDEGTLINAGIGLVGGLVVGQVLGAFVGLLTPPAEGLDMGYLASSIVGGLFGGASSMYLAGTLGKGPLPH